MGIEEISPLESSESLHNEIDQDEISFAGSTYLRPTASDLWLDRIPEEFSSNALMFCKI